MHWILILTIVTGTGTAITEVGPFVNKNNCTKASNKWLMDVKKNKLDWNGLKLSAICVQK